VVDLLWAGPEDAVATLLFAHGAGAAMDSAGMSDRADALAEHGIRTARFEFGYMAARREGTRRPPPKAETLAGEYDAAVAAVRDVLGPDRPAPLIGGHSMGGRVASLVADPLFNAGQIAGLVCLSYPWHPPEKPDQPRTAHLEHLAAPALIVQGTRDPFGSPDEVAGYALSPTIHLVWLDDGDHDLRPRKAVSGHTYKEHLGAMADAVAGFARKLGNSAP
jgi:predicted alpha/beta-hydrolase family hydrolase